MVSHTVRTATIARLAVTRSALVSLATLAALVALVAGCSADTEKSEEKEEATGSSAEAVSVWKDNYVQADTLYLRSSDATNGPIIGTMHDCSTFYVDHVDWDTRMAYGYSYEVGKSGWAAASYLSANECPVGGGGTN